MRTDLKIIGHNGEQKAIVILKERGYEIKETNDNHYACPYDIIATKDNIIYAMNVKTVSKKKGIFGIQFSNIQRLLSYCKSNNAIPVYFLVYESTFAFLKLDEGLSSWDHRGRGYERGHAIGIYLNDADYDVLRKNGKPSAIGAKWIKERCEQERKEELK